RLMSGRREVDDGEPPLRQRNAGGLVGPHALVVRPAMPELVGHAPHDRGILPGRSDGPEKAYDSAHAALSPAARPGCKFHITPQMVPNALAACLGWRILRICTMRWPDVPA